MTDKERRIEILKDKGRAQAFGLLDQEFRNVLEKAEAGNCLIYDGKIGWTFPKASEFYFGLTYCLVPGYEPEPESEYIEIEIIVCGQWLYLKESAPGTSLTAIKDLSGHKDFVCFYDPFGKETTNAGDVPGWMRPVAAQDGDYKIYARFIKRVK